MRWRALLAAGMSATAVAAGCGDEEAPPASASAERSATIATGRGLTAELPQGWQQAGEKLTPHLTDPREVLAAGTFPMRPARSEECGHIAVGALEAIGPADAFVTLQERGRGGAGFPPRPERFGPELGGPSEATGCTTRDAFTDHWFEFGDGGRRFHVLVAFGLEAPQAVRAQAWAVLDSLEIDPSVLPDWSSTG